MSSRPLPVRAIVAIPAHNEVKQIENCLAALAVQRDQTGAPIYRDSFSILIFANNCSDGTAAAARAYAALMPHAVVVVEEALPPARLNAGWARKRAMDLAAISLTNSIAVNGIILTTDADSCVSPVWFAANMRELVAGADCVAGYIDGNASEIVALGQKFLARGRLEDSYLRLVAEIYAHCDPRPHNPWPNHRVSSGASLAITLPAYSAIGGLPPHPLGEDAALTEMLDRAGFKVRHSMDVCVSTSCRFDGRALGGAADTMRLRHDRPDAPCDEDIEPALQVTRRAICQGALRRAWGTPATFHNLLSRLGVSTTPSNEIPASEASFADAWQQISRDSAILQRGSSLRPSDLPRQIAIAEFVLKHVRPMPIGGKSARGDTSRSERSTEPAFS